MGSTKGSSERIREYTVRVAELKQEMEQLNGQMKEMMVKIAELYKATGDLERLLPDK